MMMFDPMWLVLALPGMLLGLWASSRVRSAYARASQIPSRRGRTGADVAREILDLERIGDVVVEPTGGFLSDHYHPVERTLRLSEDNYHGDSLAAVGISAHEVGHAIQHARGYLPLMLRSALVPLCQVGGMVAQLAMLGGLLLMMMSPVLGRTLLLWAVLGYGAVFLFTLVTVPVELNASSRALRVITEAGLVDDDELPEVRRVLGAAALTYVAAAVSVLGTLLYAIHLYGRASED
jgi:Zn-dependent membrane protease YugP